MTFDEKSTLMQQICHEMPMEICSKWFQDAADHCVATIKEDLQKTNWFWTSFKNILYPDISTELAAKGSYIKLNVNEMTKDDCITLLSNIAQDYAVIAPRYITNEVTNKSLWNTLSVIAVLILQFSIFLIIFFLRKKIHKFRPTKNNEQPPSRAFNMALESRMNAISNRSLGMAKYECVKLPVLHRIQSRELITSDDQPICVLKVSTKLDFDKNVISCSMPTLGRLYRKHNEANNAKQDSKTETITKAMQFLESSNKLHLLILFDKDYDDANYNLALNAEPLKQSKIESPQSARCRRIQVLSIPKVVRNASDGNIEKKKSNLPIMGFGSTSPRATILNSKSISPTKKSVTPTGKPAKPGNSVRVFNT